MAEQKCPTCNEEGIENILSISSVQKLSNSPCFYVVYGKACGHVYGVFAKEVFTIKPSVPFSIPISLREAEQPRSNGEPDWAHHDYGCNWRN
jgi:hypothetical protein